MFCIYNFSPSLFFCLSLFFSNLFVNRTKKAGKFCQPSRRDDISSSAVDASGRRALIFFEPLTADGADEQAISDVVQKTISRFGKIDTLVNNAQVSKSGVPLAEHTKEDFDLAIYSGLYATFFYMRACYPYLKQSGGSVINFASGAGLFGKLGQSSYAAAKEGIRGMSRVAAAEWGPDGVRVNVVCPLAMTESLEEWKQAYPDLFAKTIQGIPLGRFADPEKDIGRVCVFLASDDASYVTGETITLQGGSGLRP